MPQWTALSTHARYNAAGIDLHLIVEPSDINDVDVWYWKIVDEEGSAVRSGVRDTMRQAKASATRAAKTYCQTHRDIMP